MKFKIHRTSNYDAKPCDESFQDKFISVDVRSYDEPVKVPMYKGNAEVANKDWYSNGTNHRVEKGEIKRDFHQDGWFVQVNSLEELLDFQDRMGCEIILNKSYQNEDIHSIEIYDDYRE